jgi:hypothetical protein
MGVGANAAKGVCGSGLIRPRRNEHFVLVISMRRVGGRDLAAGNLEMPMNWSAVGAIGLCVAVLLGETVMSPNTTALKTPPRCRVPNRSDSPYSVAYLTKWGTISKDFPRTSITVL